MPKEHIVSAYDTDIENLTRQIIEMGGLVEHQLAQCIKALTLRDIDLATRVMDGDDKVDQLEEEIDKAAIRILATRQPMAVDLRLVAMALKISNDLERMADYATNIARRAVSLADTPPVKPLYTIPLMSELAQSMVADVLDAYAQRDTTKAVAAWHRDKQLDEMYTGLFRELVTYMLEDPRNITACIDLMFCAKHLERIGDHACNIAEKIHYMMHGQRINRMPQAAE